MSVCYKIDSPRLMDIQKDFFFFFFNPGDGYLIHKETI